MAENNFSNVQEYIADLISRSRAAQKKFEREYTDQRAVDEVCRATGMITTKHGLELAQDAVAETGMGDLEGKIYKMSGAALMNWVQMRGKKSVGMIDNTSEPGIEIYAKPLGVIGAVMPSTNPIATVVANAMMAFKCRNSICIAPHPGSAKASMQTVNFIREALKEIGAPEDLILCVEYPSIEATNEMMRQCDVNIATGGAGMVKAVYSAGKPAFGVGQGNCQEIIDEDYPDFNRIAISAIGNRSFDLGVPCIGDQMMHVPAAREEELCAAMEANGAFFVRDQTIVDKIRETIFPGEPGAPFNRAIVGKTPQQIGEMIGFDVPASAKVLFMKVQACGKEDEMCREILCPMIRYRTYDVFEDAVDAAVANLEYEGAGHSSSIWSKNKERIDYAAKLIPVCRFHIEQCTGGTAMNGLPATTTIGCGSWGNNSISENLQWYHLYNKTRVTVELPDKHICVPEDWDIWE